jgi:hypothetical protein
MSNYLITAYRLGLKVFRLPIPPIINPGIHNSILHTLPRATKFFRKEKIEENNIFKARLAGIAQRDERGGRILQGNNTRSGTVFLRSIKFQCPRVWVSTGFLYVHTVYTWSHVQSVLTIVGPSRI